LVGFNSSVGILVVRTLYLKFVDKELASVSIPRSEFWSFGLKRIGDAPHDAPVSIPRSEFWSFGRAKGERDGLETSVFQFLGRNSGRSDPMLVSVTLPFQPKVSIPRSEFWSFGQARLERGPIVVQLVSIPRSEFWSFGRPRRDRQCRASALFQFLGRNSGRSDVRAEAERATAQGVSIPRSEFWSFGQYRSG